MYYRMTGESVKKIMPPGESCLSGGGTAPVCTSGHVRWRRVRLLRDDPAMAGGSSAVEKKAWNCFLHAANMYQVNPQRTMLYSAPEYRPRFSDRSG